MAEYPVFDQNVDDEDVCSLVICGDTVVFPAEFNKIFSNKTGINEFF